MTLKERAMKTYIEIHQLDRVHESEANIAFISHQFEQIRSEAFEESARIAEGRHSNLDAFSDGTELANKDWNRCADEIADVIRARARETKP